MKLGIVGLPNVGKSTLFNAITSTKNAEAANYPFCTIEPNSGIVAVPDKRLDKLAEIWQTNKKTPRYRGVRGHRRPRQGRKPGCRPRQQVPRPHPRVRCHRPCRALLRR